VGRREDDDGWTESFLPTYVYDAMKVKKRFEHMRVSFLLVSSTFRSPVVSPVVPPFLPFYFIFQCFSVLSHLMTIPIIQGGHQEDAEEFFGFYLDTLEEELLAMLAAVSTPSPSNPASTSSTNAGPGKNAKLGSVTGTTSANANTESESVVLHDDADGDGWLEVGKRNRTVVTRTVCLFFFFLSLVLCRVFSISLLPSIHPSIHFLLPHPFTRLLIHGIHPHTDKRHRVSYNPDIRW
jgi:ubiquitin carboxyl-terminal hydrolase 10